MCRIAVLLLVAAHVTARHPRAVEKLDTVGLLQMHGWKSEEHKVQTEDGYMLLVHRVMGEPGRRGDKRLPVLLQHGMLCASDSWVLRGSDKDLAIMMLKAGYDVWLGNVRGNTYGKSHVTLNHTMDSFWNYSFHEMGYYDLPAVIDHMLKVTSASQLYYIGHSMGTTMFYVMCSTRPQYNHKVRAMLSLAPIAFMSHVPSFLKLLARNRHLLWNLLARYGVHEVWPRMPWLSAVEADLCRDGSAFQPICVQCIFAFTGSDYKQLNTSILPMMIHHLSSTNPRTLVHFGQNILSGRFQQFDYGPDMNSEVYGTSDAPDYDLSLITAPVSLHYSTNDLLSFEKDIMQLAYQLPNLVGIFRVPYKQFNHIDYIWGTDADDLLYKDIIRLMNKL